MKRTILSALMLSLMVFAATGCAKRPKGPDVPIAQQEALEKSKAPVNLLGKKLRSRMASELQEKKQLDDGRMRVSVNLRNRTTKPLNVEVRAVFKDERGISIGDETAWEDMFFEPMQSKTWTATSRIPAKDLYTVEVRMP